MKEIKLDLENKKIILVKDITGEGTCNIKELLDFIKKIDNDNWKDWSIVANSTVTFIPYIEPYIYPSFPTYWVNPYPERWTVTCGNIIENNITNATKFINKDFENYTSKFRIEYQ